MINVKQGMGLMFNVPDIQGCGLDVIPMTLDQGTSLQHHSCWDSHMCY
jgi:hypothetical protein